MSCLLALVTSFSHTVHLSPESVSGQSALSSVRKSLPKSLLLYELRAHAEKLKSAEHILLYRNAKALKDSQKRREAEYVASHCIVPSDVFLLETMLEMQHHTSPELVLTATFLPFGKETVHAGPQIDKLSFL
jgi:hypothetical protein